MLLFLNLVDLSLSKISQLVGEQIFCGADGNPFLIKKELNNKKKEEWITTLDLAFLTLFSLYMLIEECWKKGFSISHF